MGTDPRIDANSAARDNAIVLTIDELAILEAADRWVARKRKGEIMEEQTTLGEKKPELASVPTMPDAAALEETMKRAEAHLNALVTRAMAKVREEVDAAWNPSIAALEERERDLIAEGHDDDEDTNADHESVVRMLCAVEESLGTLRYSRLRSRLEMEQAVMRNMQGAMPRTAPRMPEAVRRTAPSQPVEPKPGAESER